ncbi:hypothetical protein [Emticicia sp. W12TSBA100-4]|uniref:hypothetical protein n=1 Tax=Emticicia sp. W12TSBA100-4 TaxID=3160965 RepID=UPI0033057157
MSAIILESQSAEDLKLLVTLANKLGVKSQKISTQQWEDHLLAARIDVGMKTETVNREDILKALGKL